MKVKYTSDCPKTEEIEMIDRNGKKYYFPYDQMSPTPSKTNQIRNIYVDPALAGFALEGF